jgi:molecular chaperone DnaK
MASFIGIDLGTTYSLVSYLDDTGRPQIIRNAEGQNLTPSCIEINGDEVTVGEIARKGLGWNDKVLARFKRDMGTSEKYKVGDKEFTPTECSVFILKKLLADAKAAIGEVGEAVVTIPANFTNEARVETLAAAKLAGLNVKNIVNEPTAAALYYVFQSGGKLNGNFAVYDLGGGTFDISIIQVVNQDVTVLASEGVKKLGGDDFDGALQKIVQKKYKEATGEDLDIQKVYTKTDAEEDKKSLSKREKVNVRVVKTNIELTRSEFEKEISSLLAQTEMLCENAIEEAGLKLKDIKDVLLVGGSTRVPCVTESVKKTFKRDPVTTVNVDEAVVLGASLFSAVKGDQADLNPVQKASISKLNVTDVSVGCFGTKAVRGSNHEEYIAVLIKKNEKIPCSVTQTFYTMSDNQTAVDCTITQSDAPTDDPKWVNVIWDGSLSLPSGRKSGQKVDITYSYDENGTMHASFVDVSSGKETNTSLSDISPTVDEKGDIDKFIVD